jgi:hypothetical protein
MKARAFVSIPGTRGKLNGWWPAGQADADTIADGEAWCRLELGKHGVARCQVRAIVDEHGSQTWAAELAKSRGDITHRRRIKFANEA